MSSRFTRRDLLQLGGFILGAWAFRDRCDWFVPEDRQYCELMPMEWLRDPIAFGRVTVGAINIFREPAYWTEIARQHYRDEILQIFEFIEGEKGPEHNPRWYRVAGGFAHSAYIQRVETHLNRPVYWVPDEGQLFEVTVPFTQAMRYTKIYGWVPVYRLYQNSVHWVTGVDEGPDGDVWYRITDDLLHLDYHAPAQHMRFVHPDELTPISPDVPFADKFVEVSLENQTLTAYEGDQVVMHTTVSTGLPSGEPLANGVPSVTPRGNFNIQVKMPVRHMGNGDLTDNIYAYELPGVPWVSFFHETGVGFHGTYWHDNFGREMSHGCVNMRMEEAKWLFRWLNPISEPHEWLRPGFGTPVWVY